MIRPIPTSAPTFAIVATLALGLAVPAFGQTLGGVDQPSGRYTALLPASSAMPDPTRTPGVTDPRVTPANIRQTICVRGYTRTVRPPVSYTEPLKRRQIGEYGYSDRRLRDYEEDHLISLELGGAPTDPRNLWPEPHHPAGGWGSYAKDRLENKLHHLVCSGRVPLATAQDLIAHHWIDAYKRYVGPTPNAQRSHRYGG